MRQSDTGRLLVAAILAAALTNPVHAAKLTDKEHTRIEVGRPAEVPDDATLEEAGAVIGAITLDIQNIFDSHDPRESNGLYHLANKLHIKTKPSTIRAQLLFKTGDKYLGRKLEETERALRLLSYIYDARVTPVRYADGKVDIKVTTKDVWTLSPGISFGRAGGTNNTRFNLEDSNFLGWGKSLQISKGSNVDRTSSNIVWTDPNVLGSRWMSKLGYSDASDGSTRALQVAHPFYSLDAPWSAQVTAVKFDRTVSRYNLGEVVDQFNDNQSSYELSGGISNGLIDGWTKRLTFGMRYDSNQFLPTPNTSTPAKELPPDRILSYPFVGFAVLQDKYAKVGDQNQIGRTEDVYFGTSINGELGFSSPTFGADRRAIMVLLNALRGIEFSAQQELFLTGDVSTRIEEGRIKNLIADAGGRYYWRWRDNCLLYVGISGTVTDALDPELQLLLGGDNGLRGYPLRYESGTSRALLTVEQRIYTDWYPFRLVRVGGAIFADVGRTWGSGVVGNSDPGLLKDVGFGIRLGNTRSGLGNVLHIDFAFPLNNIAGIQKFQFLVQTEQTF